MNNEVKAQAVNTYEAKADLFNAWTPNDIIDLVIDEDKEKLVPYIEQELTMAKNLGIGAGDYIHELEHLLVMVKGDENV